MSHCDTSTTAFDQHAARTYCAYLAAGGEPGEVGVWFEHER